MVLSMLLKGTFTVVNSDVSDGVAEALRIRGFVKGGDDRSVRFFALCGCLGSVCLVWGEDVWEFVS
jgi:hypothetical protein